MATASRAHAVEKEAARREGGSEARVVDEVESDLI